MKTLVNDLVGKLNPEDFEQIKNFSRTDLLDRVMDSLWKGFVARAQNSGSSDGYLSYAHRAFKKYQNLDTDLPQLVYTLTKLNPHHIWNNQWLTFLGVLCTKTEGNPTITFKPHEHSFGYGLSFGNKSVTIISNLHQAGEKLQGGELIVHGDIYDAGTQMSAGILTIKGHVGNAGAGMTGGTLNIEGTVQCCGSYLDGGTIHIKGKTGKLPDNQKSGRIYVNNELIYLRKKQ